MKSKNTLTLLFMILFMIKSHPQQWNRFGEGLDYPVNTIINYNGSFYCGSDWVYVLSGNQWIAVTDGMHTFFGAEIYGLEIFSGDLFAGGNGFWVNTPDLNLYNFIGRYNNGIWTTCGTGTGEDGSGMDDFVNCLLEYNGNLYAGGRFGTAGGDPLNQTTAPYIARFDGNVWGPVGEGMNGNVTDMVIYNGELVVSGFFTSAGGIEANYIAKWNGSSWSTLGTGMDGKVTALAVYNSELYAGGLFGYAGGTEVMNIAKWNGSSWSPVGNGVNDQVYTLAVYNNELYAGGTFRSFEAGEGDYIMRWDGSQWKTAGLSTDGPVIALFPDVSGLIVGGNFSTAGGDSVSNIAKYSAVTGVNANNLLPNEFYLSQNYPNPFNPATKIRYTLPTAAQTSLKIYDVLGKEVSVLVNEEKQPGNYEVQFPDNGMNLKSGVYFYTLKAGSFMQTRKMIFIK